MTFRRKCVLKGDLRRASCTCIPTPGAYVGLMWFCYECRVWIPSSCVHELHQEYCLGPIVQYCTVLGVTTHDATKNNNRGEAQQSTRSSWESALGGRRGVDPQPPSAPSRPKTADFSAPRSVQTVKITPALSTGEGLHGLIYQNSTKHSVPRKITGGIRVLGTSVRNVIFWNKFIAEAMKTVREYSYTILDKLSSKQSAL